MRIRIPIFRRFKHDELKKVGIPNGDASDAVLSEIVANTNRLIGDKTHVPDIRETHDGSILSDESLGWLEKAEVNDGVIFGTIELTPLGEKKKAGKLLRWVSSSIRRDFDMKGDGSEKLPGLYLDHVAFLGRTKPKIKGLADLASAAGFSDKPDGDAVLVDESQETFSLFSEVRDEQEEKNMDAIEQRVKDLEAKFSEQSEKLEQAKAELSEVTGKLTTAEARVKELEEEKAKSETEKKVAEFSNQIDKLMTEKKIGAEMKAKLEARAKKVVESGDEFAVSMFAESLEDIKASKPIVPEGGAQFSDEDRGSDETLTAADFAEEISNPETAQKIQRVVRKYADAHGIKEDEAEKKLRAGAK